MVPVKVCTRIQSVTVRLLILSYLINFGSVAQRFSNFTCDNATEINFVEVCDGEVNCSDGSDETGCDNNPVLFYYIHNRILPDEDVLYACQISPDYECFTNIYGYAHLNVTGVYLNSKKEFSISLLDETVRGDSPSSRDYWDSRLSTISYLRIHPDGPQFYISYTRSYYAFYAHALTHVTRAGSIQNVKNVIGHDVTNLVFDLTTAHVYYIIGSTIKVCDQSCVICISVQSKFINRPVLLTISSKHRLLFWIERVSAQKFHLYKYSTDMSSKSRVLHQDLQNPELLTVDIIQERVYWVDSPDRDNNVSSIHSIKFEGTDHKVPLTLPEAVSSLAVFNNIMYWSYKQKPQIWMCAVGNCAEPTLFQQIDGNGTINVGSLTVDHPSSYAKTTQNPCTNSSCSHLCLLRQNTSFSCYCEGSDRPLPATKNNDYCEDTTMILTYENHLYVYGFLHDVELAPIITEKRINMNSISSVTYDSIKGNIILTETGQQKIFSWRPRTENLTLLSDDGLGTIKSIEFDDYANNLYWIDPVTQVIRVMNLDTRLKLTILEGNSTYIPIQLTLAPQKGYMFVKFLKNYSIIMIERIPMDGGRVGPPILVDEEIDDATSLYLYYRRETEALYLLDRQTNKIRSQTDEGSGFRDMTYSKSVGNMDSITSIGNVVFWLEDDMIYQGLLEKSRLLIKQKTTLGFKETKNGTLKMAPVVKSVVQPSFAKCLQNNGGCQELCLVSDETTKFACACTGNKILVNGSLCRDASVNVMNSTTRDENSRADEPSIRLPKSGPNIDGASTTQEEDDVIHTTTDAAEHESTCIKSCPPINNCSTCVHTPTAGAPWTQNDQSEILKNETRSTETCPVCQSPTSALTSDQSSTSHIFNWIFSSILAILLGFVLGYVFQKYRSGS